MMGSTGLHLSSLVRAATQTSLDNILVSRSSAGEVLDTIFIQFGLGYHRAMLDLISVIRSSSSYAWE